MFALSVRNWLKRGVFVCCFALLACTPNPTALDSAPQLDKTLATLAESGNTQAAFAYYSMAWDGEQLWQYIKDEEGPRLLTQNLLTETGQRVQVQTEAIPQHRSMTFGQGNLWLLDNENTLYQLSLSGKLLKTLPLKDMPAIFGAEAVAWHGDELWVLHKTYLSPENKVEPPRFFQIDLETGKPLKTVIANEEGFRSFSHQNLFAADNRFYLVRTSIFNPQENTLYTVDMETGTVTPTPLDIQVTGMPTLFQHEDTLYGVELLDLEGSCTPFCVGRLVALPSTEEKNAMQTSER